MAGFMNGLSLSSMFGAPETCVAFIKECTEDKPLTQLSAVVKKFMREHPEHWHRGTTAVTFLGLAQFCIDLGYQPPW